MRKKHSTKGLPDPRLYIEDPGAWSLLAGCVTWGHILPVSEPVSLSSIASGPEGCLDPCAWPTALPQASRLLVSLSAPDGGALGDP